MLSLMRTKKGDGASASAEPKQNSAPAESTSAKTADRLSFFIDAESGLVQWDRISGKTKTQLEKIFRASETQSQLGYVPPSPKEVKEAYEVAFDATEVNAILDLLQVIDATAAAKMFDVPLDITTQAYTFTDLHRSKLTPTYAALLNKWGPSVMKTWKQEIGAALVTVSVLNAQYRTMRALEKARKPATVTTMPSKKEPSAPPPPPKPAATETDEMAANVLDSVANA
jgi:hypothetical protein